MKALMIAICVLCFGTLAYSEVFTVLPADDRQNPGTELSQPPLIVDYEYGDAGGTYYPQGIERGIGIMEFISLFKGQSGLKRVVFVNRKAGHGELSATAFLMMADESRKIQELLREKQVVIEDRFYKSEDCPTGYASILYDFQDKEIVFNVDQEAAAEQGKGVSFTILNHSDKVKQFTGVSVEGFVNGRWQAMRFDIGCPCLSKCSKGSVQFQPRASFSGTWDGKDNGCEPVGAGQYRVTVGFSSRLNDCVEYRSFVYSDEFTVK